MQVFFFHRCRLKNIWNFPFSADNRVAMKIANREWKSKNSSSWNGKESNCNQANSTRLCCKCIYAQHTQFFLLFSTFLSFLHFYKKKDFPNIEFDFITAGPSPSVVLCRSTVRALLLPSLAPLKQCSVRKFIRVRWDVVALHYVTSVLECFNMVWSFRFCSSGCVHMNAMQTLHGAVCTVL